MIQALLVRVTTNIVIGGTQATTSWIVATSNSDEATQAVRALNPSASDIRVSNAPVPEEVVRRYNLSSCQAHQL